jgi:hypothetical protein
MHEQFAASFWAPTRHCCLLPPKEPHRIYPVFDPRPTQDTTDTTSGNSMNSLGCWGSVGVLSDCISPGSSAGPTFRLTTKNTCALAPLAWDGSMLVARWLGAAEARRLDPEMARRTKSCVDVDDTAVLAGDDRPCPLHSPDTSGRHASAALPRGSFCRSGPMPNLAPTTRRDLSPSQFYPPTRRYDSRVATGQACPNRPEQRLKARGNSMLTPLALGAHVHWNSGPVPVNRRRPVFLGNRLSKKVICGAVCDSGLLR